MILPVVVFIVLLVVAVGNFRRIEVETISHQMFSVTRPIDSNDELQRAFRNTATVTIVNSVEVTSFSKEAA